MAGVASRKVDGTGEDFARGNLQRLMCFGELAIAIKSAEGLSAREGANNLKLKQSVAGKLKSQASVHKVKDEKEGVPMGAVQELENRGEGWSPNARQSKATRHDDKAVQDEARIKEQSLKEDQRHLQSKSNGDRKLERGKNDKSRVKKRRTKIQVAMKARYPVETGRREHQRVEEAALRGRDCPRRRGALAEERGGISSAAIWNKTERTWHPTKPAFRVMTGRRDRQRTEEAGFPSKDRNGEVAKRGGGGRQRVEADVGGGEEAWQREADGIVIWGKEGRRDRPRTEGSASTETVVRRERTAGRKKGCAEEGSYLMQRVKNVGLNPSQLGSTAGKRGLTSKDRQGESPGPRQSAGEGGPREEEGVGRESHITSKGKERGG
ncbi:hypothetical protein B0H13DRAFT_1912733 [Mycena leptocephala]|nr:hypothetical protein B0H13DRAFT_1912733 [Mycena leptocephala]